MYDMVVYADFHSSSRQPTRVVDQVCYMLGFEPEVSGAVPSELVSMGEHFGFYLTGYGFQLVAISERLSDRVPCLLGGLVEGHGVATCNHWVTFLTQVSSDWL